MGYHYKKETVEQDRCVGANCDKCGKELEQAFGYGENFYHSVDITASGGYGMLVDNMVDSEYRIVLCKECGTAFMKEWFPTWKDG